MMRVVGFIAGVALMWYTAATALTQVKPGELAVVRRSLQHERRRRAAGRQRLGQRPRGWNPLFGESVALYGMGRGSLR